VGIKMSHPALAYHLTWTTYGTWLRGDRRGYVGRTLLSGQAVAPKRHQFGTPYDADHGRTYNYDANAMKGAPVHLTPAQASRVAEALREGCDRAGYALLAAAVMDDHVHVLVAAHPDGKREMMRRLKNVSAVRLTQTFGRPGSSSTQERGVPTEGAHSTGTHAAAKAAGSTAAHPAGESGGSSGTHSAAKATGSKPESPSKGGRWWTRYGSYREIFDAAGMDAVMAYIAGQQDILAFVGENPPGLAAHSGTAHPPAKAGGSLTQAEFGV
jgi:REP element-mobilizing transposase RayT